ncbi:MAG: c-type cytochrome [Planctomycetota bacterium]|jgi:mono/diheme cytochrome c family protein
MRKLIIYVTLVLIALAMIPPALIARTRAVTSPRPRIHVVMDMDNQPKFRAQQANPLFLDGRAMRPPVPGTVAVGELDEDDHFIRGRVGNQWAATLPARIEVNLSLLERGRERFDIYCQPCHGLAGYGDGIVNQRAMQLVETGTNGTVWVQPKSLHEEAIRIQPVGQIFNTVTNGIRNMPRYDSQISVADRWAVVAYVKALQRSQNARPGDIPAGQRENLKPRRSPEGGEP